MKNLLKKIVSLLLSLLIFISGSYALAFAESTDEIIMTTEPAQFYLTSAR